MFNINQYINFFYYKTQLHKFLRKYLDTKSKENVSHNQRDRTYNDLLADEKEPINAPSWTLNGYNGELQEAVSIACE